MITVNSLSGGKTSSYLAAHYPADVEVFALCCIDDHNAGRGIDKGIKQLVNDRLQKFSSHWPEFVATSEDPKVLKVIFDLEQHTGREITWLRGMGWEKMLAVKNAVPNSAKRFCTTILKMIPIFEYLFNYHQLPVKMRIGYRWDEKERADNFDEYFRYPMHCEMYESREEIFELTKNRIIQEAARELANGMFAVHRHQDIHWRVGDFCLIDDKVGHWRVQEYWRDKGIDFPPDSNCLNCFWKDPQQLRKNFDTDWSIMHWAAIMEVIYQYTFRTDYSLLDIKKMGLQLDFFFGTGVGCAGGFCTN